MKPTFVLTFICFLHEIVYVEIKMPPMHGLAQWLVGMWGG